MVDKKQSSIERGSVPFVSSVKKRDADSSLRRPRLVKPSWEAGIFPRSTSPSARKTGKTTRIFWEARARGSRSSSSTCSGKTCWIEISAYVCLIPTGRSMMKLCSLPRIAIRV